MDEFTLCLVCVVEIEMIVVMMMMMAVLLFGKYCIF
jgi:hypothetical protein